MSGRWEGREYVWDCPECGCVRCSKQAPGPEEAKCLRCRHGDAAKQIQDLVDRLDNERTEWMARARRAERTVDEQCDAIAALRNELAALKGVAA